MSKRIRMMALGALTLTMMGMAWAGGNKSAADTSTAPGAGQNPKSPADGAPAGQGANSNGNGAVQSGSAANPGSNGKDQALQRKQARAARHADIDKARQQSLDSLRAAYAGRKASEAAGSSEIVNEKVQSEARAKGSTK